MNIKKSVNSFLGLFGYGVHRVRAEPTSFGAEPTSFGVDPFRDIRQLITADRPPLVFDVGANVGQSIQNLRHHFREPTIHCFEPSRTAFAELQSNAGGLPGVVLNNVALGSRSGEAQLFESASGSPMSSLLQPGSECWGGGGIKETVSVRVSTVDDYCGEHGIDRIDILKIDTQGYDFEVIKGAAAMIAARAVHLIYMELIFSDMYRGLPRIDEIYGFLMDRGFVLVTLYPFYYWANKASWTEGLFMHPEYRFRVGT